MSNANRTQVVGLYSFPKSGNTWLRAIIAAAVGVPNAPGALQKYVTDTHYGKVMENPWQFEGTDWYFYKSHRKSPLTLHQGEVVLTDKFLYIYRHPLDVFLSYLNFMSKNVQPDSNGKQVGFEYTSVESLTPAQFNELFERFVQFGTIVPQNKVFGGIFENIENFRKMKQRGAPVHIIRYEDLQADFKGTTQTMFDFLEFKNIDSEEVYKDADSRTAQNGKFFWKRSVKNYESYLTKEQIDRFMTVHKAAMEKLGYDE